MSISPFEDDRDYLQSRAVLRTVEPLCPEGQISDHVVPGSWRWGDGTPIDALMPAWTFDDQEQALARGWGVFEDADAGPQIQRYDEAEIFASDQAACLHVRECQQTSPLCRKAILFLGVAQREWHEQHGREAA